jgi:hypothetical protein
VDEVMRRLNDAQVRGGGNPFVGQRLEQYFDSAGFARVEFERPPMLGSAGDPRFFQAFVDEFAEIFEGLDESLGVEALPLIQQAISELRALPKTAGGSLHYTPVIARAWR